MRFKDWLNEELSKVGIDQTMTQNPTADTKALQAAISQTTKLPDAQKLATLSTNNDKRLFQKTAVGVAQTAMQKNPLWAKTPAVTAPAIADGLIKQFAGNNVPTIGSNSTGTQQ